MNEKEMCDNCEGTGIIKVSKNKKRNCFLCKGKGYIK